MARDRIVVRQGKSTIEVDMAELRKLADKLTDGAVSTFLDAAHRQMDPVTTRARSDRNLWPRRTGKSQAATRQEERISANEVSLTALNNVKHTFKLRFSVRTKPSMDREASQFAAGVWGKLAPYVERVGASNVTQRGPYAGRRGAKQRVANHYMKGASRGVWAHWYGKDNDVNEASIRLIFRKGLASSHGRGAPNEQLAGKHVWGTVVRKPLRQREKTLIAESRNALDKLAKE